MRRWVVVGAVAAVVVVVVVTALQLWTRHNGARVKKAADRVSAPPGWLLLSQRDKNDAVLGQCLVSSGCVQSIRTWLAPVGPEEFIGEGRAIFAAAGFDIGDAKRCELRPNVQPASRDCEITGTTPDAEVTLRWRHPEYAAEVVQDRPVEGRALVVLTVEPG